MGLFMLDVDQGTVWAYEIGEDRRLRLIAGRTFIWDRYLKDFNCGAPSFREVQGLIEHERRNQQAERDSRLDAQLDSGQNDEADSPPGE